MYKEGKGTKKLSFIKAISDYAAAKRIELEELEHLRKNKNFQAKITKGERLRFLEQIIPVHIIKKVKFKPELAYECLERDEPILAGIFELYDTTSDLVDWIENFKMYASHLPSIHCWLVVGAALNSMGCSAQEKQTVRGMIQAGSTLLQGVHQVFCMTRDQEDLEDSLKRILRLR